MPTRLSEYLVSRSAGYHLSEGREVYQYGLILIQMEVAYHLESKLKRVERAGARAV